MTYHSNPKRIDSDAVFKDVLTLIEKHTGGNENVDLYGPTGVSDKGFYLIFIKRDDTIHPTQRVIITTFGQHMNIADLAGSLTNIIQQTIEGSNRKVNYS